MRDKTRRLELGKIEIGTMMMGIALAFGLMGIGFQTIPLEENVCE